MKNLMMIAAISFGITASAMAQIKVPSNVKNAFAKEYPGTKVKWEKEGANYEAGFTKNRHEMSVIYNSSATTIEREMEMKVAELPKNIRDYVSKNFKGSKIKEAAKITKSSGEVQYEAEVNGKDVLFTPQGKLIKSEKGEND